MLLDHLCLLIGLLDPFTFGIIIDVVGLTSDILLYVFYMSRVIFFISPLLLFFALSDYF